MKPPKTISQFSPKELVALYRVFYEEAELLQFLFPVPGVATDGLVWQGYVFADEANATRFEQEISGIPDFPPFTTRRVGECVFVRFLTPAEVSAVNHQRQVEYENHLALNN